MYRFSLKNVKGMQVVENVKYCIVFAIGIEYDLAKFIYLDYLIQVYI